MDLLRTWAEWERVEGEPPYILDADRSHLKLDSCSAPFRTWSEFYSDCTFGDSTHKGRRHLHLGLLPHPFCGDLRRATIYILLLNPGLGFQDWFGESEIPEFRNAVRLNLRQEFHDGSIPFMFLDPRWGWHGGFEWWNSKLSDVIRRIAIAQNATFSDARRYLAKRFASIELFPYHSTTSTNAITAARGLRSAQLAIEFVHNVVLPRVQQGKAIVIVTRKVRIWDLPEHPRVIKYGRNEARAAHLSLKSPGGRAILEFLGIPM